MATIGEQIRQARKTRGMTQDQLGAILNVSRQAVSHWEQGRTTPDAEMFLRISQALEYSFEEQHPFTAEDDAAVAAAETMPAVACTEQPPACEEACAIQPAANAEGWLSPAMEPPAPKAPPRRKRLWMIAAAALLMMVLLGGWLLLKPKTHMPAVKMDILEDPPVLSYVPTFFAGHGYGWLYTLSIHNESNVPLHPDRVVVLYYVNERISGKSVISYEEMREFMDADLLNREDTPLHLLLATNYLDTTHAECILYATDPEGRQYTFSISTPLLPPAS